MNSFNDLNGDNTAMKFKFMNSKFKNKKERSQCPGQKTKFQNIIKDQPPEVFLTGRNLKQK